MYKVVLGESVYLYCLFFNRVAGLRSSWNTMSLDLRKILTKIIFSISSNCPWYGSFEKYIKNMPGNPEKYAELSEYWTQMKFQILPQTVDSVTCYVMGYWFFHRKLEGHTSVYLFFMISFNGRGCGEIMRKFGQIEQQLQVFQRLAFALWHNARHGNPSLKKRVKKKSS